MQVGYVNAALPVFLSLSKREKYRFATDLWSVVTLTCCECDYDYHYNLRCPLPSLRSISRM